LLADARRGAFDVVVVWRFDRFARSVKQLVLALEEFRTLGIDFVSHQESLDTSTPMGGEGYVHYHRRNGRARTWRDPRESHGRAALRATAWNSDRKADWPTEKDLSVRRGVRLACAGTFMEQNRPIDGRQRCQREAWLPTYR